MKLSTRDRDMFIGVGLAVGMFIILLVVLHCRRGRILRINLVKLERSLEGRCSIPYQDLQTGDIVLRQQPNVGMSPFHFQSIDHCGIIVRLPHFDQIMIAHARTTSPSIVMLPIALFMQPENSLKYYVRQLKPRLPMGSERTIVEYMQRKTTNQYDLTLSFDYAGRFLQDMCTLPPLEVFAETAQNEASYCTHMIEQILVTLQVMYDPEEFLMPIDYVESMGSVDKLNDNCRQPFRYGPTLPLHKMTYI